MNDMRSTLEGVRRYYGEILKSSADLKTSACCAAQALPAHLSALLSNIHPEIKERFYGCGAPLPPALEGLTVLDLGCGTGRDCYLLSQLVGPAGRVIGLDMTPQQLALARKHMDFHAHKFGYANVEFRNGYMEDLAAAGIATESIDLVVSNCVINLSPDKRRVLNEIFRVLKKGGELYFSDIFASRRVPENLQNDPILRGECLSGALYTEDFRRIAAMAGCNDARAVTSTPVTISNNSVAAKTGNITFRSLTIRAFKLDLEDRCEDFGQLAIYHGSLTGAAHAFELDGHHRFETGKPMLVCGNTADMLSGTRYAPHFSVIGDKSAHYGLFDCGPGSVTPPDQTPTQNACC
jgi:ubiquinone/menaquinone biosynthesis C-methylase UbiE